MKQEIKRKSTIVNKIEIKLHIRNNVPFKEQKTTEIKIIKTSKYQT